MPEYKIKKEKIVFNADFKPSVDFFTKQTEVIKALNVDYPDWELSGINFAVQDKENHCSGSFSHAKIIYEIDDANDKIDFFKERIIKGIKTFNEYLHVDLFKRLGVRFFMFIPMREIKKEELSELIQSKLLVINKEIIDIASEKVSDLAYIIDYNKDGFLYHLKCGPMPKDHIPAWINFSGGEQRFKTTKDLRGYLESLPEISFFIDIDCYKNAVADRDMESFINKTFDNCLKTSVKLKEYVLGE